MSDVIEDMRNALEVQARAIATITKQRDEARAALGAVVHAIGVAYECTINSDPRQAPCGDCCKVAVETIAAALGA